jgi:predicted MPP superfamily phosphohydrolase
MTVAFVVTVAVVLGLLLFLVHEIRRPVKDSKWDHRPRRRKRLRIALVTILLLIVTVVGWAFVIGPNRLVVRHETLQIEQWPSSLANLKIAVLSDIHAGGAFIDERKLRLIVERTNQLQPDLIVILGDYISGGRNHHDMNPEVFAPFLKDFRAPLGVYSVLGNHDWWYDGQKVRRALEANGIKVLENEVARLETRGTSLWLVGLADLWTRPQRIGDTIANVPAGEPLIAITHNPDIFPQLPQGVSLLLAGHTHGGQVRFPFIGTVTTVSRFGDRYVGGHIVENGRHLFVTTGIGTSIYPVRFGVPPEIVLVTVTSKN